MTKPMFPTPVLSLGSCSVALGYESLEDLVPYLSIQTAGASKILKLLAEHPSPEIRVKVAKVDGLPASAKLKLLNDDDADVVVTALRYQDIEGVMTKGLVRRLINFDRTTIYEALANNVYLLRKPQRKALFRKMVDHNDPGIRMMIADNVEIPRSMIVKLSKDVDPSVMAKARERLQEGSECQEDVELAF